MEERVQILESNDDDEEDTLDKRTSHVELDPEKKKKKANLMKPEEARKSKIRSGSVNI